MALLRNSSCCGSSPPSHSERISIRGDGGVTRASAAAFDEIDDDEGDDDGDDPDKLRTVIPRTSLTSQLTFIALR